jgi:hypothetical protein
MARSGGARAVFWWALGGAALLWLWSRTEQGAGVIARTFDRTLPRGIRNNNPGNIERTGTRWRGMAAEQSDPRFVVFEAPEWGLRAMARILKNDILAGRNTVRALIYEWAPPTENVTDAYVVAVARALGVGPDEPIGLDRLPALMRAITRHENGVDPYPPELYARAIQLEQTA